MMIKVVGIVQTSNQYCGGDRQPPQTKYYQPEQNKQAVKDDFKIMFDKEMSKLHFDKII